MNVNTYRLNLIKEEKENIAFIKWLKENRWRYRHNDGELNFKGSDFTISKDGIHLEVDLKGCRSEYDTVALTYASSIDGKKWYNPLSEHTLTDIYCFIDEAGNIEGFLFKEDVLFLFNEFKKSSTSDIKGGKHQKLLIIPKSMLRYSLC